MNTKFKLSALTFFIIFLVTCKDKPTPPIISTTSITEISATSAVSGGNITDDGGAPIISKGICWNTSNDPKYQWSYSGD